MPATSTYPAEPVPAVNAPVVSFNVEHLVPLAVHVESESMYQRTGETPPLATNVKLAPSATVLVAGVQQSVLMGENVIGTSDEVDGRCDASPPYIATTSTV
jgi:hypothetical protein